MEQSECQVTTLNMRCSNETCYAIMSFWNIRTTKMASCDVTYSSLVGTKQCPCKHSSEVNMRTHEWLAPPNTSLTLPVSPSRKREEVW